LILKRHLAIGDIHGCYKSLRTLVDFVGLGDQDVLVTLGDYVDRGPDSCAVLDWLIDFDRRGKLVPLRGNHDLMMLRARDGGEALETWFRYGGDVALKSYAPVDRDSRSISDVPEAHWQFLEERLQPYFETGSHFFVHANAYADLPLDEQPETMLYWEKFGNPPRHDSGKIMICGHTSQKDGLPVTNGNAVCIDTWACGGEWLTCLCVETGDLWQANQQGETRTMHIDDPKLWIR